MISAGVWVVLGLAIAIAGVRMHIGTLARPASGLLPALTGATLACLGMIALVGEWRAARRRPGAREAHLSWSRQWRIFAAVVALLAYGLLLSALGEAITTFLLLGFLFRVVAQLGWVASVVATVGATTLSHLLFAVWLKVPFPPGPWAP